MSATGEREQIDEAVSNLLLAMRCWKGCCLAPSTRIGLLSTEHGTAVDELNFCDRCGGVTVQEFPYAKELRVLVELLEKVGRFCWDEGSIDLPSTPRPSDVKYVPTRELLAIAMWVERTGNDGSSQLWKQLPEEEQELYRCKARALLIAVRGASAGLG